MSKKRQMTDVEFEACSAAKLASNGNSSTPIWDELAHIFNYSSAEAIRSAFKRERHARGVMYTSNQVVPSEMPRVGIMDIEVLPMELYGFGLYDQNFGINQIIENLSFLSWSAKYINEPETYHDIMTPREAKKRKDRRVTESALEFLRSCDIVIGHNIKGYDQPMMNSFILRHDMWPAHYSIVDTLSIARKNLRLPSYKLDYIARYFGLRPKVHNDGMDLWAACAEGSQDALDEMLYYNDGDILTTEDVYYKLRPFVKGINAALYNEINQYMCGVPGCGSTDLVLEGTYYTTTASQFETLRCQNCGSVSRKPKAKTSARKRANTLRLV